MYCEALRFWVQNIITVKEPCFQNCTRDIYVLSYWASTQSEHVFCVCMLNYDAALLRVPVSPSEILWPSKRRYTCERRRHQWHCSKHSASLYVQELISWSVALYIMSVWVAGPTSAALQSPVRQYMFPGKLLDCQFEPDGALGQLCEMAGPPSADVL